MSEPSSSIRVAMLGAFPPQSQGVADYCGELAQALGRRHRLLAIGYRAMYPAFLYPGEKATVDRGKPTLDAPGLTVEHRLTYYNPLSWLRAALVPQVDVFHAQWWSLPLWPVTLVMMLIMRLRGKRLVLTVHNVLPHDRGRLYVPASRLLARLAHRVVVHSAANREQLTRHYRIDAARVHQVPHGIFFSKTRIADPAVHRRRLGVPDDAEVVLLYGALRAYKGIDVLLRAFAEVAPARPRVHVVIAGKSWVDWQPYQRLVDASGAAERVHVFPTFVPESEVAGTFAAADLVVLPYTAFDAQSGVAATALPFDKPMIVSRTGGLPEWVDHDEGWIVEPGAVGPLAERIVDFFENRTVRATAFADLAERVRRAFAWETVVDAYDAIYGPEAP